MHREPVPAVVRELGASEAGPDDLSHAESRQDVVAVRQVIAVGVAQRSAGRWHSNRSASVTALTQARPGSNARRRRRGGGGRGSIAQSPGPGQPGGYPATVAAAHDSAPVARDTVDPAGREPPQLPPHAQMPARMRLSGMRL